MGSPLPFLVVCKVPAEPKSSRGTVRKEKHIHYRIIRKPSAESLFRDIFVDMLCRIAYIIFFLQKKRIPSQRREPKFFRNKLQGAKHENITCKKNANMKHSRGKGKDYFKARWGQGPNISLDIYILEIKAGTQDLE